MECRWLKLKSLHQQILSGSLFCTPTDELKQLTAELKVLLSLEIGQCEKFPSRCLHCHQLLALTVLKMMFEHPGACGSNCSHLLTALEPVLMKNLYSKDEFIRYSTVKYLVVVLKSADITEINKSRILTELCEKMKLPDSPKEKRIILQLFSQVMSRKHGDTVNKQAFEILKKYFPGNFETVAELLKCNRLAQDFYTLLIKVTKYLNWQSNSVELLKEIFDQNLIQLVNILLENLQSSEENTSTRKLLDFFNTLLCYSEKLALLKKVDKFYADFAVVFVNKLCSSEVSFNLKTSQEGFMGDIVEQLITDFPTTRRLVLVLFKAVAVVMKSNGCHTELESKIKECLQSKIYTNLPSSDSTLERLSWLCMVFEDQDDSYIETLLCSLDIYINTPNRDPVFSPYPLFFQFLETFDFDSSIVMDWLVSPETCFLLYVSRLLKTIISEWTLFVKAAHDRYPENCGQDSVTHEDVLLVDCYIMVDGCLADENLTTVSNTAMDVSDENSQFKQSSVDKVLEGKVSLCDNEKGYSSVVKCQGEVIPLNDNIEGDQSLACKGYGSATVLETISERSSQDQIASLSQGLSAIMAYSDSDSDESEDNFTIPSESSILKHQLGTSIKSCDNASVKYDHSKSVFLQSEIDAISCDRSKSESIQSVASKTSCDMKCLDRVMSLFIHVRIQIERLVNQDLFPYNPAHLLSLIIQCEDLYES